MAAVGSDWAWYETGDAIVCVVEDTFNIVPVPSSCDQALCEKDGHLLVVRVIGVMLVVGAEAAED